MAISSYIDHIEQLSACHFALLLDSSAKNNKLMRFLRRAQKQTQFKHSICIFKDEPYLWKYSDHTENSLETQQISKSVAQLLVTHLQNKQYIDTNEPSYEELKAHLAKHFSNIESMFICKIEMNNVAVGFVVLFDEKKITIDTDVIEEVTELCIDLGEYIALKQSNAELKEINDDFAALTYSQTKFFQIIAHDLRAPFHGLLGFSEVLADEVDTLDTDSLHRIASYLNDTAQSTYHLLENLLNWAMAEGGQFVYHPKAFCLHHSSHIVTGVLNSLAVNKKIELVDQIPDQLEVYADMNMVTSILQNLVSNALKFTPTDGSGKVIIFAENDQDNVRISITDTGLGMDDQQQREIFQPKIKTSLTGTAGEKGTGLGLVLCKRFVDLNHGEITVNSKKGLGTTFEILLPNVPKEYKVQQRVEKVAV
ncbi:sensor histidine kinase [Acinetobacter nectaris]|uniref:sensor histidine kinase n=1 Tax=Acinetobacter nectaris TaxID=1219382 RepID=UPI001F160D8A|nr:HAMP domain-containing sensor histidine kinase [Acinetobacter nectaris]MCF9033838.1 HAMP domain-containing histidine kinase [Acinetobacter nectaris]